MSCTKCKKKRCGCSDKAYTTPASCPQSLPVCSRPDPCAETFSAGCIVYTGDEIADLGISKGDRMDIILQKLILAMTNPLCTFPGNSCLSVIGLQTSNITSTTLTVSWLATTTPIAYSVEYRQPTSGTWIINPSTTSTQDTISGLLPNTEYVIRVNTICGSGSCYSLTIKIKTKAV